MGSFNFSLVSPERELVSKMVDEVVVPGVDGDFTVLEGHAPVISGIRPGMLTVLDGEVNEEFFIRGGIAEARADGLIVLAEYIIPKGELDSVKISFQIKDLEEDVADASDDEKRNLAQEKLDHLREIEKAIC